MSVYSIPPALGALLAIGLAIFISFRGKRSIANVAFSMLCLSIFLWLASYAVCYSISSKDVAIIFARLACTAVACVSLFLYHFVIEFLKVETEKKLLWIAYGVTGLFLIGFIFTDLLLSGAHHYFYGFYSKAGILHPVYLLITYAMWFRCFFLLYKHLNRQSSPLERNQVKYVFVAFLVAVPATIDYLPKYGVEYYPFGFIFALLLVLITAFAIIRHKLFDVEVVVRKTVVFAGLVGSVVAVVSLVAFVSQDVLARVVQIPKWLSNMLAAAIIAAVYGPVRDWLVNATDRYLFQKKYDYKELLKKFTDDVMVMVDLKQLVQMTTTTLSDTVKLSSCSLLLLNKDTRQYELVAAKGVNGKPMALGEQEHLITFLQETHEPIWLRGPVAKVTFPETVTGLMQQLSAEAALPLEVHEDLIGVLCLGKKKSDEEFTKDDQDILLPLAKTLAIAVSNAQLFDELAKTQAEAAQKEKLAVIGTLSAGINHEICNPLGIVKAQCEAFLLDVEDGILIGKSSQELLDRTTAIMRGALKQIDRATAITQKLSNFAKPIKEPTAQPVSVAQEIDEVFILVGHDLKLEKIEAVKEIQPDLPPIVVDRRQLQEVLFNLIRNAGQAIMPPGTIWVRAHTTETGQVRIEITDTGSGIPPDKLGKIYDPFFTTKEPGKGTGLGLFIVRQIVERNKGRIAVESTVGKGTTFFLDFPVAKPHAVFA